MFPFLRRRVPEITVDELDDLMAGGLVHVVDVREDHEFRAGHVHDAIHVPLGELARRVGSLPRDRRIAVICQSGNRSLAATDFLLQRGFEGAASVRGGTGAWARSGRPIERGSRRVA